MSEAPLTLAGEFPPATREQWLKLVEGVLKGASFDAKLVARTADGLPIAPASPAATGAAPIAGRAPSANWQVFQRIELPDPAAANAEALHELENGATGLSLIFAGATGARGYGLDATPAAIARLLDGIVLDADIAIELELGPDTGAAGLAIADLVQSRGIRPETTNIRFAYAPLGAMLLTGSAPRSWDAMATDFMRLVSGLTARGFRGPFAVADGRIIHDAGGTEVHELACMMTVAVTYLRGFADRGMSLESARQMVFFRVAADADMLLTIAKLRALRKLWARIEMACGLTPAPAFISAHTAWRMMTKRDPHTNILRTTIAAAAAGLGGADAVAVLPFTLAIGLPDRFARRLARNTQLVLLEEASLARVSDPAAGAGGIEDMTEKLCAAAWSMFQEFEAAGGAFNVFASGLAQRKIAVARAEREAAVASGTDKLVGATAFPNTHEIPVAVLDVPRREPPARAQIDGIAVEALPARRLAEAFE